MSRAVNCLSQRTMNERLTCSHSSLHCMWATRLGYLQVQHVCIHPSASVQHTTVLGRSLRLQATRDSAMLDQPRLPKKAVSDQAKAAAARYASARHLMMKHQLAHHGSAGKDDEGVVSTAYFQGTGWEQQMVDARSQQVAHHQQQQQQQQLRRPTVCEQLPAHSRQVHDAEQTQKQQTGVRQQLHQHISQNKEINRVRKRQMQLQHFSNAIALYDMCARSDCWMEWQQAAYGLQGLVKRVNGPLQAQQVWQVATALQAKPLLKQYARVLGGAVVELVKVTLHKHDPTVLRALIASQGVLQFCFSKRHMDKLLLAAVTADVSLEELQAVLTSAPRGTLSNRSYFILIKAFVARQQFTEAAHCFHHMENLGLHLTPALQQVQQQLLASRSGIQQHSRTKQMSSTDAP